MREEEIKECIEGWLKRYKNGNGGRMSICPLGVISLHCNICAKIFPSLSDGHGWVKHDHINTCPCHVLNYDYVIKRVKRFLKEGFKNN